MAYFTFFYILLTNLVFRLIFGFQLNTHTHRHRVKQSQICPTCLHMTVAPPGSFWDEQNERVFGNPDKNFPWGVQIPFFKEIKEDGDDNQWRKFLDGEWTYLNHKNDIRRPAGVIEGGSEMYDGMGLELPGGLDRPRAQTYSKILDHGVEWRQNLEGPIIKTNLFPDGNQDIILGETDEQFEERQWGSWGSLSSTEYQLETGWREPLSLWDPTGMPHPWLHSQEDVQELHYSDRSPSAHIPHPPIDWELAAYNLLGDYQPDNEDSYIHFYNLEMKNLARLEQDLKNFDEDMKTNKKKSYGYLPKAFTDSLQQIDKKLLKGILIRTRDIIKSYLDSTHNNPHTVWYYLNKREIFDHTVRANWNCEKNEITNKTVVFNNAIYGVNKYSNTYYEGLSKSEMAEMYHYLMTELHREGRKNDFPDQIASNEDVQYELKKERSNFPALISIYKPLWTTNKFGEEFGYAIPKEKLIRHQDVIEFGKPLPKSNITHNNEDYNFVDDYN